MCSYLFKDIDIVKHILSYQNKGERPYDTFVRGLENDDPIAIKCSSHIAKRIHIDTLVDDDKVFYNDINFQEFLVDCTRHGRFDIIMAFNQKHPIMHGCTEYSRKVPKHPASQFYKYAIKYQHVEFMDFFREKGFYLDYFLGCFSSLGHYYKGNKEFLKILFDLGLDSTPHDGLLKVSGKNMLLLKDIEDICGQTLTLSARDITKHMIKFCEYDVYNHFHSGNYGDKSTFFPLFENVVEMYQKIVMSGHTGFLYRFLKDHVSDFEQCLMTVMNEYTLFLLWKEEKYDMIRHIFMQCPFMEHSDRKFIDDASVIKHVNDLFVGEKRRLVNNKDLEIIEYLAHTQSIRLCIFISCACTEDIEMTFVYHAITFAETCECEQCSNEKRKIENIVKSGSIAAVERYMDYRHPDDYCMLSKLLLEACVNVTWNQNIELISALYNFYGQQRNYKDALRTVISGLRRNAMHNPGVLETFFDRHVCTKGGTEHKCNEALNFKMPPCRNSEINFARHLIKHHNFTIDTCLDQIYQYDSDYNLYGQDHFMMIYFRDHHFTPIALSQRSIYYSEYFWDIMLHLSYVAYGNEENIGRLINEIGDISSYENFIEQTQMGLTKYLLHCNKRTMRMVHYATRGIKGGLHAQIENSNRGLL